MKRARRTFLAVLACLAVEAAAGGEAAVPKKAAPSWEARLAKGLKQLADSYPWNAEKTLRRCYEESLKFPEDDPRREEAAMAMADAELYLARARPAQELFEQALARIEARAGKDALDAVRPLAGIADCRKHLQDQVQAEAYLKRARQVAVQHGEEGRAWAWRVREQLEKFYDHIQNHALAEQLAREALAEAEKAPIIPPASLMDIRRRIARYLVLQRRFEEGAKAYEEVLEICAKLPNALKWISDTQGEAAKAYEHCRHYVQAVVHYRKMLELCEAHPKELDDHLGWVLREMGRCLVACHKYAEAEEPLERALKICERYRAPPRILECMDSLAIVYRRTDRADKAVAILRRALQLQEKYYGKDPLAVVDAKENLAQALCWQGHPAEAEPLMEDVYRTQLNAFGALHVDTALTRCWLAYIAVRMKRPELALERYRDGTLALAAARGAVLASLPEHRRLQWLDQIRWPWRSLFEFALQVQDEFPNAAHFAHDAALLYQGTILETGAAEHEALLASQDPALRKLAQDIGTLRGRLAALVTRTSGGEGLVETETIQQASARIRALEIELTRACAPYARQRQLRDADPEQLRKAVPADAALALVLRLPLTDDDPKTKDDEHYIAFTYAAEGTGKVLDLGPAQAIEEALARHDKELTAAFERLAAGGDPARETGHRESARQVSTLFLKPLWERLREKPRWLLCLDGPLATLPVATLPLPGEDTLVLERFEVSYLTRAAELLAPDAPAAPHAVMRVLADPDFDAELAAKAPEQPAAFSGIVWQRLPGTAQEAQALADLCNAKKVPVEVFTGAKATREALFHEVPPRYLHLATHGFCLPEKFTSASQAGVRGLAGVVSEEKNAEARRRIAQLIVCGQCGRIHNRSLRSGLVLAGANRPHGAVVLSEELGALNLVGTELVALSACESGLGDIAAGEGVLGMHRGFLQAGARSVLGSLWKIPDRETKDLMVAFYRRVLEGQRKSAALREAMLEVRSALAQERGAAHPFYWAGFILVGQPD